MDDDVSGAGETVFFNSDSFNSFRVGSDFFNRPLELIIPLSQLQVLFLKLVELFALRFDLEISGLSEEKVVDEQSRTYNK